LFNVGFSAPLFACCGAPGQPYNYSNNVLCGATGSQVLDPAKYISWDGDHLTEAANKLIAEEILSGAYASPPL
jgi:lysophospholipase L1-like esterase